MPERIQTYALIDYVGQLFVFPENESYVDSQNNITNTSLSTVNNVTNNSATVDYFAPSYAKASSGGIFGGGGGSIICTKMYEMGHMTYDIYKLDQAFGEKIEASNPDVYNGYISWAATVVEWLNGQGPAMPFVDDADRQALALKWGLTLVKPWADEMARQMGKDDVKPTLSSKLITTAGMAICGMIGKYNRIVHNNKPQKLGKIKVSALVGVLWLLQMVVSKPEHTQEDMALIHMGIK
jgi:hypothetical protein